MACLDWKTHSRVLGLFVVLATLPLIWGLTNPRDVYVVYQLHSSLGFPPLSGWAWMPGGDPCGPPSWQGVECIDTNITAVKLSGASLEGELPQALGLFTSILLIDLSNNQIGGSLPSYLPITLRSLNLNKNLLTGSIPDFFQQLVDMTDIDLSENSLIDELPSSMGNLSSLTTLHLQENQLSGTLDVLRDLPLRDLNIENNLFSGTIPNKLISIPNFRRAGNLFNSTIPPVSPSEAPAPASISPQFGKMEKSRTRKFTLIAIGGSLAVLVLVIGLFVSKFSFRRGSGFLEKTETSREAGAGDTLSEAHKEEQSSQNPLYQVKKASNKVHLQPDFGGGKKKDSALVQEKHRNKTGSLPLPLLPSERIITNPTFSPLTPTGNVPKMVEFAKFFTVASLQQYTDSFSEDNLIGKGTLGAVYRAQFPDGKVLAVKKVVKEAGHLSDQEFLELVSRISRLKHKNIVEFVGYCLEYGQRLLVYSYCSNGTLDEVLDCCNHEMNKKLTWKTRMHLALQAAKALEYLHETCKPPIMHWNFTSCNVLLQDDFTVQVSDCGLAPLLSSTTSMAQLQGSGYGAPELELGSYSYQSDVYSFGVVMLQLLTGRKSFDSHRPLGEQYLVRWAFSRLHDIDALSRMVDPSLNGAYPSHSVSHLADIISLCIQPEAGFRPPMSEIVQKLLLLIQRDQASC